jgi:DNA-binding NarL/FixJ family response regulator
MRQTILIGDDNTFICHALYELFRREADLEVCAVAENGREAIEQAGHVHPGLVVLDLAVPAMNGLDAARVLRRMMPSVPLNMYSAFEDRFSEQRARLIGTSEFVSKSERISVLIDKARGLFYPRAASRASHLRSKIHFAASQEAPWRTVTSKNYGLNSLNSFGSRTKS